MRKNLLSAALVALLVSCGRGEKAPTEQAKAAVPTLDSALLDNTWPARMAVAEVRAPYESNRGWSSVFLRKHDEALGQFSGGKAVPGGQARVHTELATLYRQGALLAAHATVQVYKERHRDTDPAGVNYLVGVSLALLGDAEGAKAALAALPADVAPDIATRAAIWKTWLDAGATWPPSLEGFPGAPGAVGGDLPTVGELPHFHLPEQTEEAREVWGADPTSLYLLSQWHEDSALAAAPEQADAIHQVVGIWRLPAEPAPSAELRAVSDDLLFASFYLTPEDVAFLAAASGEDGAAATATWAASSPLAAVVGHALVEGKVVPEELIDEAAAIGSGTLAAIRKASGKEESYQPAFARFAEVGALRAGALVADRAGQERDSGVLMMNARNLSESSVGASPHLDPTFFVSCAAWDAAHGKAQSATDLLHPYTKRFPALEVARYPLDALALRIMGEATGTGAAF